MNTKQLFKQVRDKVVEKYKSEKILMSQRNIQIFDERFGAPSNPSSSNGKNMVPQQTCQKRATHQNSIRQTAQRPKLTLKELQSSTAETRVSVHRTTISRTLHRAGLYRRVARKNNITWC